MRRHSLAIAPTVPDHEPDIASVHKDAVIGAIRRAWQRLVQSNPALLRNGEEEAITAELQFLLNEFKDGDRVIEYLTDFQNVTRGESQRTADGRLGKKPDLTFRPSVPYRKVVDSTSWGWFVECKVIDGGASVAAYRDKGVQRFSEGEYAARMESGAMLAYVRDGASPGPALGSALSGKVRTKRCALGPSNDRSVSEHDRLKLSNPCVDVTLTHLWLAVP